MIRNSITTPALLAPKSISCEIALAFPQYYINVEHSIFGGSIQETVNSLFILIQLRSNLKVIWRAWTQSGTFHIYAQNISLIFNITILISGQATERFWAASDRHLSRTALKANAEHKNSLFKNRAVRRTWGWSQQWWSLGTHLTRLWERLLTR